MCKAEELAAITAFTQRLPHGTYLRPWLESILPEIEADMRNDFPIAPSPQAGRAECERLLAEAHAQIERERQQARQEFERTLAEARDRRDAIVNRLAGLCRSNLRQLGFAD